MRLRLAAAPVEPEIPVAASEVQTDLTEEQRAALQAFAEIDVDGDGELTADEIYQALSKRDASVSLEHVKELVAKADTDGDGIEIFLLVHGAVAVGVGLGYKLFYVFEAYVRIILRERPEDLVGGQLAVSINVDLGERS